MNEEPDRTPCDALSVEDGLRLNAYLDGELDGDEPDRVERWIREDPEAAACLELLRGVDSRCREALDGAFHRPVDPGLGATLEQIRQRQEGTVPVPDHRGGTWWRPLGALAAGVLLLAVGYGLGVTTTTSRFDARLAAAEASRAEARSALARALEYTPSGTTVNWASSRYNASAELQPVRTLKMGDDRYCREYRETLVIDGVREERRGLSCRLGRERWQTRLIIPEKKGNELF